MSNNNGGGAFGALFLLLIFGYIIAWLALVAAIAMYAFYSFWAIVMTLVCVFAWNRPRRFFHLGITPYQARGIVCFGAIGSILLPAFGLYCGWLFELELPSDIWFYCWLGGYAAGAYGFADEQEFTAHQVDQYYQLEFEKEERFQRFIEYRSQETSALPAPQKSFDYADWQDPVDWEQK